jgi:hypothetical protein
VAPRRRSRDRDQAGEIEAVEPGRSTTSTDSGARAPR